MLGRSKKKSEKQAAPELNLAIHAIPDIFYGGNNPVIYQSDTETLAPAVSQPRVSSPQQKTPPKPAASATPSSSRKLLYTILGLAFITAVAGISWYYIAADNTTAPNPATVQPSTATPVAVNTDSENLEDSEPLATSTDSGIEEPEDITPPSLLRESIEFPSVFLIDSSDIDSDSLTDEEEEIFTTDTGTWDTDGDGYYDGQEVVNLYSPRGSAPMRLIDSGLVTEYVSPNWQYRLYYPTVWEVGAVDADEKQMLFSAAGGDYVEVRVVDKPSTQTFEEWFAMHAPGQNYQQLLPLSNRFQEDGYKRSDSLVAYFVKDTAVIVLVYHPGIRETIAYRHVMEMIIQSFRREETSVEIPEQQVILNPAATTSTPSSISTSTVDLLETEETNDVDITRELP